MTKQDQQRVVSATSRQSASSQRTAKRETPAPQLNPAAIVQRTLNGTAAPTSGEIRQLQRSIGNRAVGQLLSRRRAVVQAKLTVGAADDSYEREADRVATQVMNAAPAGAPDVSRKDDEPGAQRKPAITPLVQRQGGDLGLAGSFSAGQEVESQLASNRSSGSPIDAGLRASLEPRFGADFSHVRVHTGAQSDHLNRTLGAQAFTHSNHIYMAAGKYNPGSTAGQHLLAHELTHVVQQGAAGSRQIQPSSIQRAVTMYDSIEDANKASKRNPITGTETALKKGDLNTAFTQVEQALNTANMAFTPDERKAMKAKLKEWIEKDARMSPTKAFLKKAFTFGKNTNTGRAQDKRYGSYEELGRQLLGHIRSRKHKKTESSLAAKTKKSAYIKGKLQEVQRGIYTMAEAMENTLKTNFWAGMSGTNRQNEGEYRHWYKGVKDVKAMLQHGTGDFKQAITSIHDTGSVMLKIIGVGGTKKDNIENKGGIETWSTGDDFMGTVEKDDGMNGKTRSRERIGGAAGLYRANSTSVAETNDWVKTAREHGALLWAGPSHTTSDMMVTMRSLRAKVPALNNKHSEAVAWAIFAFWNKDFFTFKDGYHTFHEVMDIASQYGVPYTPFEYPTQPPGGGPQQEEPEWNENPAFEGEGGWHKNPLFEG